MDLNWDTKALAPECVNTTYQLVDTKNKNSWWIPLPELEKARHLRDYMFVSAGVHRSVGEYIPRPDAADFVILKRTVTVEVVG